MMTFTECIGSGIWCLFLLGYLNRRHRWRHVPLMLSAIILDVVLVVYLQMARSAVQTALETELTLGGQIHIASSTVAGVLYVPIIWLGAKILRGNDSPGVRLRHRRVALSAFFLRTIGFLFMFSV